MENYYLVSYPKSGNTWVRFLLANYLHSGSVDFDNIQEIIPEYNVNPITQNSTHFFKSHESYNSSYQNVIYVVRDPRDMIVSFYYYRLNANIINSDTSIQEYIYSFLSNPGKFGQWNEHVRSWYEMKDHINILFVKYEDLVNDVTNEFLRILEFVNLPKEKYKLIKAIRSSDFQNLRLAERKSSHPVIKKIKSNNSYFTRKGRVGDYARYFDKKNLSLVEKIYKDEMKLFGYE